MSAALYKDHVTIERLQNGTDRILARAQVAAARTLLFVLRKSSSVAIVTAATDTAGALTRICGSVSFDRAGLEKMELAIAATKRALDAT